MKPQNTENDILFDKTLKFTPDIENYKPYTKNQANSTSLSEKSTLSNICVISVISKEHTIPNNNSQTIKQVTIPQKPMNMNNEVLFDLDNLSFIPDMENYLPYSKGLMYRMGSKLFGGMTEFAKNHYTANIAKYWEKFFKKNNDKFFKNRQWMLREYLQLKDAIEKNETFTFCEIGCGCGNTINGILSNVKSINENFDAAKQMEIYGFDCSSHAVELLKETYKEHENIHLFVHDLLEKKSILESEATSARHTPPPPHFIQYSTMIYVLSAFSSLEDMKYMLNVKIHELLSKGGILFLRDYAVEDLAHKRYLEEKDIYTKQLSETCFVRGDGTLVYFFSIPELTSLFDTEKYDVLSCEYIYKVVENRGESLTMNRKFIQIVCRAK
ncbi:S-adenosylmethionine-dependent methyltransferase [Naegleria gruberi]|uniref:S-adenosylmethionine-dependent methyltransferase n=1 Tax=Naegleria gruberi TaxID=5762 RepID=D2VD63_NAEGR|nr:S-adenosylmethionine-dependent methyltransferase [Naegleria gruberi]EFC45178.1 S-adenosylmethionine-dependent methyltransferase [Naegleria gruberi]|eukprot:XP_002677922.1 S-adenosylmethionine-dependent methyltransferase [Naegleria gruberi strain NEG-M]